ncbi:MAG: hypothetical protein EZS28_010813 [Streblomastix strix]|uniref:Uncharacterized protein n=1 Tax=Streblomastix strix TaxID=222440 RepID=A0A5J4WH89_9EUKA|nr:MAG: hypothetical protein EZS28_010813 [Streblomastix strix]
MGQQKSTKVNRKNLALCDRFLLIERIAKHGKSNKTQRAERNLFVVKQKKIKNASNLELNQIAKCSKQFIDKKRTGQQYVIKQVKQIRKLFIEQDNKIVEWIRNRYNKKKIQTIPKQICDEIFRWWKIAVSGNFHKYLVGRYIDKLVSKIATARKVQRLLVRVEDIQKHLTNLKITVNGKRTYVLINGDVIGIQAFSAAHKMRTEYQMRILIAKNGYSG